MSITATTMTAPNPPSGSFIAAVRSSCAQVRRAAGLEPDMEHIDAFLHSLDKQTYTRLKEQHGLSFPLKFPSLLSELNFLGVLALLNGLSGYRTAFHSATGSGVYQNIVKLLFGLYITGSAEAGSASAGSSFLTAQGLASLEAGRVAELMGVSLHEEKPHETIPGLTVGTKGGEMYDAVSLIVQVCNDTGTRLLQAGYPNLGTWTIETLNAAPINADDLQMSEHFVEKLVTFLPAFADQFSVQLSPNNSDDAAHQVYVYKRAFFFLHSIHHRLAGSTDSQGIRVPNTLKTLPMFVDNVLPTMSIWFGFFTPPSAAAPTTQLTELYKWIAEATQYASLPRTQLETMQKNQPGPLLAPNQAYLVRAATLDIGTVVTKRALELAQQDTNLAWLHDFNEVDLDGYLWAVAKDDPLLRKVPRFMQKNTMMF